MTTGERIAMYRERAGVKQIDLANSIGITRQLLWKYETNRIGNIPLENIQKIGMVLGIDPSVLTGWEEEETQEDPIADILEDLRTRPEMRELLQTTKGMTAEQINSVVKMLDGFKNNS